MPPELRDDNLFIPTDLAHLSHFLSDLLLLL